MISLKDLLILLLTTKILFLGRWARMANGQSVKGKVQYGKSKIF